MRPLAQVRVQEDNLEVQKTVAVAPRDSLRGRALLAIDLMNDDEFKVLSEFHLGKLGRVVVGGADLICYCLPRYNLVKHRLRQHLSWCLRSPLLLCWKPPLLAL